MKHPDKIEGYSLERLASIFSDADNLYQLACDLREQSSGDYSKGRKQLANRLDLTAERLSEAAYELGYESNGFVAESLVKEVGNLRYDKIVGILDLVNSQFSVRSEPWFRNASLKLDEAVEELSKAWKICEPYMKNNKAK